MQTGAWTVMVQCEGCGVRNLEAERARPQSTLTGQCPLSSPGVLESLRKVPYAASR